MRYKIENENVKFKVINQTTIMSLSKYISTQDDFQKQWNITPQFYFEKTDIINLKSSEKFPFHFRTFPEFKQKASEYMQRTPTRTFSKEMAKIMMFRGTRNAGDSKDPLQLSSKFCRLEETFLCGEILGKGILIPTSPSLWLPNEFVPLSWDTIRNIFLEGKEEDDKIVLPNNSHLENLMRKSEFCMYSNQHTQSNCPLFSCPPFQLKLQRASSVCVREEKNETPQWIQNNAQPKQNRVEEEEINYNEINNEVEGEENDESEEGEIDYDDTYLPDFDNL